MLNLEKVGFWTPVEWKEGDAGFATTCDKYFSCFGDKTVTVVEIDEEKKYLCQKSNSETSPSWLKTIFLILSVISIIIPIILFIGKIFNRIGQNLYLTPSVPQQFPPIQDEPKELLEENEGGQFENLEADQKALIASSPSLEPAKTSELLTRISAIDPHAIVQQKKLLNEQQKVNPIENSDAVKTNVDLVTPKAKHPMGVLKGFYSEDCVEQVTTIDTVERCKLILQEEIKYLSNQLLHLNGEQQKLFAQRLSRCEHMLNACRVYNGFDKPKDVPMDDYDQWLGSWYFRALMTYYFDRIPEGSPTADYFKAFDRVVARFIAAPINFRKQSISCGEKTMTFLRCGVLYDPTNSFTSLKELLELADAGESKKNQLLDLQKKYHTNPKALAALNHAYNQLNDIEETIRIRKEILERQALQLVQAQIEIALMKKEAFPNQKLKIAHIGLLNEDNISMDEKCGWYHHEGYEMQDMAYIYEFLHGKTIVFDSSGPFIDKEQIIHMPFPVKLENPQIKLEAAFFNFSFQGKTERKLQNDINLSSCLRIGFQNMPLERFDNIKSSAEHTIFIFELLESMGFQTAISCLSGKDRTGWMAYQIVINFIEKYGYQRPEGLETPGAKIAFEIAEQNYGKKILKLLKWRLEGVSLVERAALLKKQVRDRSEKPAVLRGRGGRSMSLYDIEMNSTMLF